MYKKGGKRMNLRKTGIIMLALLLAAMVPIVSAEQSSGMMNGTLSRPESDAVNVVTLQKLPAFQPGINDKLSYEEEHQLIKNYSPSPPVSESDMVQVIFSKAWLLQNDQDPRPDMVQVTFPETWLKNPVVKEDEAIVMLRVPKRMLELDNTCKDSGLITVSYPENMFEGFLNLTDKNVTIQERQKAAETRLHRSINQAVPAIQEIYNKTGTKDIDKQVRAWYQRNTGYSVSKVIGSLDPTSYSNSGESFRNYNEREIYLDRSGDIIEFISDFTDTGGEYAWVAVYDEGTWSTAWNWLNIEVTGTLQQINYHFYITNGVYELWLQDTSSGTWYSNSYTDTDNPSTRVNWLVGSTEVDTMGGISNYFRTETNPIRDDATYTGSSWYSPQTTFEFNSYSSDEQYVYITAGFDGSGRLASQHIAGQKY
jgi:hypothetical protein